LVPVGAGWCQLVPVGASWCQLVPVGAGWCRLVPVGAVGAGARKERPQEALYIIVSEIYFPSRICFPFF
jgi:hypothetical protein